MKRKIIRGIKVFILLYCTIGIALYYLQEKFILHPVKLSADYRFNFTIPFKEINIPINKTDTVSLIKFLSATAVRKGVVLYFHGNKENVLHYTNFVNSFTKNGYEVWMPDYPGFGKSTGEFSEEKLYEQAYQIKRLADNSFHADSIIIYGKSFGTGIASYLASTTTAKKLILETPYSSIPDLFSCYAFMYPTSYMSIYKFPVVDYLKEVDLPITIFHGTADGVIPYRCAARLKKSLKSNDQFITIEGGSHNDLSQYDLYKKSLDSLLR